MEDYWSLFYGTGDPAAYLLYRELTESDADTIPSADNITHAEHCMRFTGDCILLV